MHRDEHGAYPSTFFLMYIFGKDHTSFSYFCHLSIKVFFTDHGGFVDGFALAFSLSTKDFSFFFDSCRDLTKGGFYFEGNDCGSMLEGTYLGGGHGDDPGL